MSVQHQLHVLGSVLTSSAALWRGGAARLPYQKQPEKTPILYDIENCPYCRLVREAATDLHLDLDIRPCPKGGTRFRDEAARRAGRTQFPLLIDDNTGVVMLESSAIVAYLYRTYGRGPVPRAYQPGRLNRLTSVMATATRPVRGLRAHPSTAPQQPLALWSFEASPYSRLVRERLCELEIPYRLHNLGKEHWTEIGPAVQRLKPGPYVPKAGGKRDAFLKQYGRVQVPYLEDPNTGAALFESADILAYLNKTYA